MSFADPWLFWVLTPVYVTWAVWWWQRRRRPGAGAAVRYSDLGVLARIKRPRSVPLRRLVESLRIVAVGLLLIAMARPQTGREETRVTTQGIDIVLVMDTSGSMRAVDLDANKPIAARRQRLDVVKDVVTDFVQGRPNDQIGVIVFGTEAFTQCPLTLDHGVVATFMEHIEIGMAGESTAIGDALGIAVKRLKKSSGKSKVVVLLTDGRNTAGQLSPRKAAEIAKTHDIRVHTIGAGTRGKAPFIQETLFGKNVIYEDVAIDEAGLKEVAQLTGGQYFRAEDADALAQIYEEIDQLEKTEIEERSYLEYNERFASFAAPGLLLLLLELVLLSTRFRKLP